MDRVPIELETFHHIYNRGTDKRIVFLCKEDYLVFTKLLRLLNSRKVVSPSRVIKDGVEPDDDTAIEPLVAIVSYCLMPNHFHLLLYEICKGGISKFMQRLGTAYTMYFNEKYTRSGALFQGRFKSRLITDEEYLLSVIDYIHMNPIDLNEFNTVRGILDSYKYSSLRVYAKIAEDRITNLQVLEGYTEVPVDYIDWLEQERGGEVPKDILIDIDEDR